MKLAHNKKNGDGKNMTKSATELDQNSALNVKKKANEADFGLEYCFYNTPECAILNFNNLRNEFVAFDKIIVAIHFSILAPLFIAQYFEQKTTERFR